MASVFIVAVAAWVIASQLGGDGTANPDLTIPPASLVTTPSTLPQTTAIPDSTAPAQSTSPIPLPTNVPPQGRATTTTQAAGTGGGTSGQTAAPPPAAPKTTTTSTVAAKPANPAGQTGGEGDLGVEGRPIEQPTCDGAFVTIIASVVGDDAAAIDSVSKQLEANPDANYLRTDNSCKSFRPDVDGEPIYVVYFGPFAQPGDACEARSKVTTESYVKRLTNDGESGPGCDVEG